MAKRLIPFLVLFYCAVHAQNNLVLNGGFEDSLVGPGGAPSPVSSWHSNGVIDFGIYRDSSLQGPAGQNCRLYYVRTDRGKFNGYQAPHSGRTYTRIHTVGPLNGNSRSYITSELIQPLTAGRRYEVSFYLNVADSSFYVNDGLGVAFTPGPTDTCNWNHFLNIRPQSQNPAGNIFRDTVNWVRYLDTIIPAGGERFITIGNFLKDEETQVETFTEDPWYGIHTYIYIDDVSVIDAGPVPPHYDSITVFPSLNSGSFFAQGNFPPACRMRIFDATGRVVAESGVLPEGNNTVELKFGLASGGYYYRFETPYELLEQGKMNIVR